MWGAPESIVQLKALCDRIEQAQAQLQNQLNQSQTVAAPAMPSVTATPFRRIARRRIADGGDLPMSFIARRGSLKTLWILRVLLSCSPVFNRPDEIALVVDPPVPDGGALAEFYARERHIPDGRIIEVNVDPDSVISPAEQMPFDAYEPRVAVPVRNFLSQNHLQNRVKCLVTFWGMPLRIGRRELSPYARDELTRVTKELNDTRASDRKRSWLARTVRRSARSKA